MTYRFYTSGTEEAMMMVLEREMRRRKSIAYNMTPANHATSSALMLDFSSPLRTVATKDGSQLPPRWNLTNYKQSVG